MTNVTNFEAFVLNAIAHHEMNSGNGDRPTCVADVSTYCWADDFTGTIDDAPRTVDQVKGVLSSLVKKGLIVISDNGRNSGGVDEALVDFTEAGFDAFEQVCPSPVAEDRKTSPATREFNRRMERAEETRDDAIEAANEAYAEAVVAAKASFPTEGR